MNAALRAVSLSGLIVLMPMVLNAQRFGFSIGAPAPQTSGTVSGGSSAASAPQMPPLPRPLPTPAVVPLPSLRLTLKPLNLLLNHLSPPQINFALDLRKPLLPALPFAIDPIAARGFAQIAGGPVPGTNKQQYAVSSDGRFLVNLAADEGAVSPITLIYTLYDVALGSGHRTSLVFRGSVHRIYN